MCVITAEYKIPTKKAPDNETHMLRLIPVSNVTNG